MKRRKYISYKTIFGHLIFIKSRVFDKLGFKSEEWMKDISMSGTKIQTNILLPINTLLNIDFTLKTLDKNITALGKVKWIKIIFEDESYEAGVEFVDIPNEAIKKFEDYISWKQKNTSLNPVGFPFKSSEN